MDQNFCPGSYVSRASFVFFFFFFCEAAVLTKWIVRATLICSAGSSLCCGVNRQCGKKSVSNSLLGSSTIKDPLGVNLALRAL